MVYCPKCGCKVKISELFCIQCGEKLPNDIEHRLAPQKKSKHYLIFPGIIFSLMLAISVFIYFYHVHQMNLAKETYYQAEEHLINQDYHKAQEQLEQALNYHGNFPTATELLQFTQIATAYDQFLSQEEDHQTILNYINQTINEIDAYSGEAVDLFYDQVRAEQKQIQLKLVNNRLENDPSIQSLPAILWEVEGIQDPEAFEIADMIRQMIVDLTASEANELLKEKQFSEAQEIVENGLYYVPSSEKLSSLLITIDNEKESFETAQRERMEQATHAYEVEHNINQNDAVEVKSVEITENRRGNIVVKGEIQSVATVPIHTIAIEYNLLDENDEVIDQNETYVYPDTLYPDEIGQFDHTYLNLDQAKESLDVQIETITWFLD